MRAGLIEGNLDGFWALAHDSGELTSGVSSYTIPDLHGDTDEEYQLIARVIDSGGIGHTGVRFNSDTGSNYGYQYMQGNNTTPQAGIGTEGILYCDIDLKEVQNSHAKRLFLQDRRPELYSKWI